MKKALIVDDEESLREIIAEVLSFLDIECYSAEDGNKAIELVKSKADDIGLVLIDLNMPVLSGEETYQQIKPYLNGCPIIFMSGYSDSQLDQNLREKVHFIKKPFTIMQLKDKVSDVLNTG
ncbi:MAG TPA: response regulator [Caldithrix abyssi]|uniref:Response regulator n=1 Tax=Caldithrix abyssi TaxID=187145 RepID=A0A7V4U1W8_CALAY|nr:response regulator [Caldithrix abyssi]